MQQACWWEVNASSHRCRDVLRMIALGQKTLEDWEEGQESDDEMP
jgi:hypothetical protein